MGNLLELTLGLGAAVLLLCLGWVLFGKLLAPVGEPGAPLTILIKGEGDGGGLEHTVSSLLWLRRKELADCPIWLVDAGLNEEGRQVAEYLCQRWPVLEICKPGELPGRME